jgi:alpha-L-fucosidase 2
MYKKLLIAVTILFSAATSLAQPDLQLRFDEPASHFTQSLPLGNGRLGAMVFGNVNRERIVLNEISMWSGGVEDPNRKDANQYFPVIQQLLKEEKNREAQQLLQRHFTSAGKGSGYGRGANVKFGCYQILGDLFINWYDTASPVKDYNRILQINQAMAITTWKRNNTGYKQEVWVSRPHEVIIVRLTASNKRALNFSLALHRKERASVKASGDNLTMTGQLNGGEGDPGVKYAAYARVLNKDGRVTATDSSLTVNNASEVVIILGAATDLNWPNVERRGKDPLPVAVNQVNAAAKMSPATLLADHTKSFQSFFDRCRLHFTAASSDSIKRMSTPDRLMRFARGASDVHLPVLYFNFGRYLLISSSRPGNLPANLQGLWAEEYETPWNGDYHLNINVQMNYWPAEITKLADLHQPLIEFTKALVEPGKKTAKAYYNSDGWVAHVISNPWKFTAPGEGASWGSTLTGGAWLCQHLWQHYQFNPDKKYLASIYPVLKSAVAFYTDILIEDPKTGWLVTAPSNSPENTYITEDGFRGQVTMGPTMDLQIGRELLSNTIQAATILDIDKALRDSLENIRKKLAPNQVSKLTGGIQEWIRDYREAEPQHRHISHLYGLHPYDEINLIDAPELAAAARKTLERRGDGATGWSRAWKINFWARLEDGDHALKILKGLLIPAFANRDGMYTQTGAGTYPNLFCAHPPFQIDGNFGATAAIAEMLLQSHGKNEVIRLLPALPSATEWGEGSIKGVRARNGFEINISWKDHAVKTAEIISHSGRNCSVKLPAGLMVYAQQGKPLKVSANEGITSFATVKGGRYIIK